MTFEVKFTRMDRATPGEFAMVSAAAYEDQALVPARVMNMLRSMEQSWLGFGVTQLHHMLQTATMARRANASDEIVLCALCHDVGKVVSVSNHAQIVSEILQPYVSSDAYHIVRTHQEFQGRHMYAHFGLDTEQRAKYRNEPWFALAEQFSDEWDQVAFDPKYPVLPLEEFEPLVVEYFSKFTAV